jgi:NAD(P)-dependent dehydrogenase (short-subunit alcohol dehydrogenase family)
MSEILLAWEGGPMSIKIKDKIALITGGARGIGLAIAKTFLDAEARVVISDNYEFELESTVKDLEISYSGRFRSVLGHVSVEDDVKNMVDLALEKFNAIDILVNNAGISGMNYFWEMPVEEWDNILDVNLKGTFLCTKEAVKVMLQRGTRGKIINIASVNSVMPTTGIAAYCASKGGLLMFTRAAALELGPHGINVNAIGPGSTLTPLTEGFYNLPGLKEAFLDRTPRGRFGEPEDIANVALFLASDYADWVTGQIIYVDGGQSLMGLPRYYEGLKAVEV